MMDDLISRQEAIAYAISGRTREIDGERWIRVSEVRENIKAILSAQRERKEGIKKPITNADGIRAMTDEELAEFLASNECGYIPWSERGWLEWLQEEAE